MQGFQGRILLKQELLELMIAEKGYLTSQQIKDKLGQSNVETIQDLCREMNDEYKQAIKRDETLFSISAREGYLFTGNLKYISKYNEYILIQDLTYQILIHAFFKKTSINSMLHLMGISYSTLRRRVIDLNEYLHVVDLSVDMKDHLSLEGKEYTQRIFIFLFMYYVHINISNVAVIVNKQKYLEFAKKLNEDLKLDIQYHKLEGFAIWVYILEYSITSQHEISFPSEIKNLMMDEDIYPRKPDYVQHWPDREWQFFSIMTSIDGIFNTDPIINLEVFKTHTLSKLSLWTDLFESYFRNLNEDEKEYVEFKTTQLYLLTLFINLEENMVDRFFSIKYDKIKKHDSFTESYEMLWRKYTTRTNAFTHSFYKTNSYFLCRNMFNRNAFRTVVKIFLYAKGGPIYMHYIQEAIKSRFSVEYEIIFVYTDYLADMVIATLPYECDEKIETVYISDSISQHDYLRMLGSLKNIKKKKDSLFKEALDEF